jgi:type I restriction enzyme S subunit
MSSAVGKMGRYRLDDLALLNQRAGKIYVTQPKKLDFDYLCHFLSRYVIHYNLALNATGSANQANISPSQIKDIELNLPPLPEQTQIANILSAIDDKIENNLAINKTLEDMAMALYKHWFVDFSPFQEGEFIDSELGLIPKGWEVRSIGDFVSHQKGYAFKSKWYQNFGELVVRVSDTTHNSINVDSCHKISPEIASKYCDYALNTDDVIIATVGSWPPNYSSVVGKVVRVPKTAEGGLLNQNAVRLKMKIENELHQGLLYYILKNERFLHYIVNSAQGSASQASIKLVDIFNYPIPFCRNEILQKFSAIINSNLAQQNAFIKENQTLTKLRDTLLPKLISGEVRLKEFREGIDAEMNSA